jgi:ABC-type molybdate transport system substrate-binding protein
LLLRLFAVLGVAAAMGLLVAGVVCLRMFRRGIGARAKPESTMTLAAVGSLSASFGAYRKSHRMNCA